MLIELLTQDPDNAFARYGLAMEYSNSGELDRALEEFSKLLSANPDYTAGYFMAAQTFVKAGQKEEAKKMLVEGIASAQRKRDAHAESEMQAMLEESFNLSLRIWFLGLDRGVRLKQAVEEHRRLLDAIVSRDADAAESVMRQHVSGFEQAIRKVL